MSSEEIRRRRTSDPEMDAVQVMAQALEPLDRNARVRVLRWAKDRFVGELDRWADEAKRYELEDQIARIQRKAQELGVSQHDIVHAIAGLRGEKKLGPVEDGPVSDEQIRERVQADLKALS